MAAYRVIFTDYANDMNEAPRFFTCDQNPSAREINDGLRVLFDYLVDQNRDHLIEMLGEYNDIDEAEEAAEACGGKIGRSELKLIAVKPEGVLWEVVAPVRQVSVERITTDEDGDEELELLADCSTEARCDA